MTYTIQNKHKQLRYDAPPVRVRVQSPVARQTDAPRAPSFRGAGLLIQTATDSEIMVSGPSETGKTMATLWRLDTECRRVPGGQFALVRKIRATIDPTVLVTYGRIQERRVAMGAAAAVAYGGSNPKWFDYSNGARLWIGGMDDPSKVLSGERDGVYVNQAEELTQADWETLSTRTTGRGAVTTTPMLFGDCNPGPEDHWILRRPSLRRLDSRHEDNPSLYDEQGAITEQGKRTMTALDALTGVRKQRLRYGLWVGAEGQYFETWDTALHACAPFVIPGDWPVWGAFDYGFTHNTAFGLFTEHDGTVYQIGEHVQHKWLPTQHAQAMHGLCARLGVRPRVVYAGHDVFANKGDAGGKTIADQYAALGWSFEHAQIDRIGGAAALLARLGNPASGTPPTFRVFTTCPRTIATIPAMVHDPRRPEDVLKVDADAEGNGGDDQYDCTRYGLYSVVTTPWNAEAVARLSSRTRL